MLAKPRMPLKRKREGRIHCPRPARDGRPAPAAAELLSPREGGFPVFADEDTLLHVIAHAVLDNQFNSGPLLLVDVAALLGHGTIDWPRFWQTAGEAGLVRAAQLALALAQAVTPGLVIDWQSHAPQELDPKVLASAAGMMLVPVEQRTELGFAGRLARFRWAERWRILLDSIARNRAIRAAAGPDDGAGSDQGLTRRFANAIGRPGRRHIRQSLAVAQWLRE